MRSKLAFKNSFFNILSLGISTIFSFVMRRYLIKYLGIEILGVNSVIAETLNTIALSELGIQAAIMFRLYQPIAEGDTKRESEIFSLFKKAYRVIGSFIICLGVCLLPFIKYIVNTNIDMRVVCGVYIIQLIAVALPYFLSYYRLLYLVHQKQFYCTQIDIVFQILVSGLQIIVLINFNNYLFYLLITYIKIIFTNLLITKKCKEEFSYLQCNCKPTKRDKQNLFGDLKEIIWGNLAGYVYSSTDSLIISMFCGTMLVGLISNYKTITTTVKSCTTAVNSALFPIWGNYMHQNKDESNFKDFYYMFIFMQFIICTILLIPTLCLADEFIKLWLGERFIIDRSILSLIVADIYINNIHEPNAIVMHSLGMFKEEKKISIIATAVNLFFSLYLVQKCGVQGVLIGTILALLFFWLFRSKVVNRKCLSNSYKEYGYYWCVNIIYAGAFLLEYYMIERLLFSSIIEVSVANFIKYGIIIEIVILILNICFFGWSKSSRLFIKRVVMPMIFKRN